MQKKLLITVLTIMLIITLTLTLHVSIVNASPVIFNMDTLPENQGWRVYKSSGSTSSVSNGILTIETEPGYFQYFAPNDWNNTVNNTKGWIIEFRMKINATSLITSNYTYIILSDKQHETHILFYENKIVFDWLPTMMIDYRNTTDTFHVYRIEGQEDIIRFYIDGKLLLSNRAIDSVNPSYANLVFGHMPGYITSYWDYISYDLNPTNLTITQPTLTVIDGNSSYYISHLTGVSSNNVGINYSLQNGIYAGWCVDKSVTMIRNEAHNVILYSTINSTLPDDIEKYNWHEVNYVLNHKQGTMRQVQDAIWYFVPDFVSPSLNETITWNMINEAKANPNYIPTKGEIMAIIAYAGHESGTSTFGSGVQNTILEYRIP